ncbi:MAG: hypothetical protein F6K41_18195 [Symploca sp. SIO3E6]|nr:hypothetical protein [Caldora sp. SIO3E6]
MSANLRRIAPQRESDRKSSLPTRTKVVQLGFDTSFQHSNSIPSFKPRFHRLKQVIEQQGSFSVRLRCGHYPAILHIDNQPIAGIRSHQGKLVYQTIFDGSLSFLGVDKINLISIIEAGIKEVTNEG